VSLAWARAWRRLGHLAVAGIVAGAVGLAVVSLVSNGVFLEILFFQLGRLATRNVGMWSIDSGFVELLRHGGIKKPWQFAMSSLLTFYDVPKSLWPLALLAVSLLGVPIWIAGPGRSRPALRALALLWPASLFLVTFGAVDFASPRYFVPFLAVSSFLLAGMAWRPARRAPLLTSAIALVACAVLASRLTATLGAARDPWYYDRAAALVTRRSPMADTGRRFC
jgi:hypothetical protein